MRIVILSIALLFCAFSAQSQVLKSAGVWYFLDVDSMTARPAVLPNGTELAYVVGTKKIYYWNRTTSTWTEYSAGGGGLTMPFDSIYFNPTTADPDTAELKYNADLETFVFGADGTIIEIGQKSAWYVKNQTGSTITKGTVVRASGTLGSSGRILVSPMVIDGTVDSKYLLGITASDIADGADGYVIHFGKLRKFNTSAWSDGAVLYAGTGGTLTATEPNPPNLRLPIAFVVHSHATNGILAIRIQTGNELHELHDVDTTGIDNGGVLVWNAASDKWKASDGAAITTADTTSLLATKYWTNSNFFPLQGGTLTGTGGAGFVGFPSQVSAPGTPASGLNVYAQGSSFNWKATDGHERLFASTLTGGRTYTLPDISGTFALGTGTADRSARWSATNTLAAGNFTDNGTKVQALLPFQFHQWTTAGRPTGVTGYEGYNTTGNGKEWYNGTRWAFAREASSPTGTANRLLFNDSNGQIADNSGLTFVNPGTLTGSVFSSFNVTTSSTATANNQYHVGTIFNHSYTPGAFTGTNHYVASFLTNDATGSTIAIGRPHNTGFHATITSRFSDRRLIIDSGNSGNNILFRKAGVDILEVGAPSLDYNGFFYSTVTSTYLGLDAAFRSNSNTGLAYSIYRSGVNGNKVAFGHNGIGGAIIYAQAANTNFASTDIKFRVSGSNGYAEFLNNTAGVLLGGGTTAETPTEVNGLIRYNSDSTLYQIYQGGARAYLATRAYARGLSFYGANGALASNRTVTGGSFWLNFDANTGIKQSSPTQELDINGDAYIRDSTRLATTPAHTAISGILTKSSTGEWVGLASLAGGLSYSGGVLSASGVNTVYTASDSIRGDRYLEMANDGISTTALGYFPSFPSYSFGDDSYGLYISPDYGGEVSLMFNKNGITKQFAMSSDNAGISVAKAGRSANITARLGAVELTAQGSSTADKYWNIVLDSVKFEVQRNVSGALRTYNLLPASEYPSTTSTAKTVLQWTGNGSNANPAFVEVKRDTTIFVTADTDYDFSAAVTTAQIASRYNRIIIHMTLTSGAGADKTTTLHAPDANLMQCEILIRGTDNSGSYDNEINFGTNNAISSDGTDASGYTLAQGQGLHVRVVYNGTNYKYIYY